LDHCDVVIIGAGPYGLSIAAHLKASGVDFRIFGGAMEFWLKHMPEGMHLKSEGFASSLYDPGGTLTLGAYCNQRQIAYADMGSPVPLSVFAAYGQEFQRTFVPELEQKKVVHLLKARPGFELTLDSGEVISASRVVVAVGLTHYFYLPPELAALSREFVSHSSEHSRLSRFQDRDVVIVGAGASALDLAALLHGAGASVQVIARGSIIRFQDPPSTKETSWFDRVRMPVTGIGGGWKLWMCANLPLVFRWAPERLRLDAVRRVLGPAPCWFTRDRVEGKVGFHLGARVESATAKGGKVALAISNGSGEKKTIVADHVIAATGYRYDVGRLPMLDSGITAHLRRSGDAPMLSANFESSEAGLYFVGVTAANTFGPLLRFAYGAKFTAPHISAHLAKTAQPIQKLSRRSYSESPLRESEVSDVVAKGK
jgi:cation diffusion facilitator CzcD-associated flavoprotein CzcO